MATMTYRELNTELTSINTHIADLNKQILELSSQKEEVKAEIQRRKQSVIDNYINLVNSLLDTQQELLEMGIDPTSIDMNENAAVEETMEAALESAVREEHVSATEVVELCETYNDIEKADVKEELVLEEKEHTEDIEDVSMSLSKRSKPTLLKPYFFVWGLRKGEYRKNCSVLEWKQTAPRLQTSMTKLTKAPVNRTMNMGNTMYRPTYATPDEGRIYSAYGTAPTLTATHSDITVRIGTSPYPTDRTSSAA